MLTTQEHNEEGTQAAAPVDKYETLKQIYFKDTEGQRIILNIANDFKEGNAFILFDDGAIWPVAYVGKVLEFFNNTAQHIKMGGKLPAFMSEWLDGKLPVGAGPQIEIPPYKIIDYTMQVIRKYPTKEYEKYVEEFGYFKILFDNCEIMQNHRKEVSAAISAATA
jgi:hypothetical protein